MITHANMWNDQERSLLDAMLNRIVPANAERQIPAAGDLGVASRLAGAAKADESMAALFTTGLRRADELAQASGGAFETLNDESQVAIIRQLELEEPAFFGALLRHTYMSYYSRPDIRALLGLTDRPVHPDGYDVPDESPELMAELTDAVRRRGQVYRDC